MKPLHATTAPRSRRTLGALLALVAAANSMPGGKRIIQLRHAGRPNTNGHSKQLPTRLQADNHC